MSEQSTHQGGHDGAHEIANAIAEALKAHTAAIRTELAEHLPDKQLRDGRLRKHTTPAYHRADSRYRRLLQSLPPYGSEEAKEPQEAFVAIVAELRLSRPQSGAFRAAHARKRGARKRGAHVSRLAVSSEKGGGDASATA